MQAQPSAEHLAHFPDCCLETPLRRDRHGYGRVNLRYNGKRVATPAHRVAYSLFVGPVQSGESVRQTCANPACCNPRHLIKSAAAVIIPAGDRASNSQGDRHD
jgi:hypothetical protein